MPVIADIESPTNQALESTEKLSNNWVENELSINIAVAWLRRYGQIQSINCINDGRSNGLCYPYSCLGFGAGRNIIVLRACSDRYNRLEMARDRLAKSEPAKPGGKHPQETNA
jgi:hypothetical protein